MRWGRREASDSVDILLVCTGNFCRSPIAEALYVRQIGPRLRVRSAGTLGVRERGPHPFVIEVLSGQIEPAVIRNLVPSKMRRRDLNAAVLILCAAAEHRRHVVELVPTAANKTFTMKEFDRLVCREPIPAARPGQTSRERIQQIVAIAHARLVADWTEGGLYMLDPESEDIPDPINSPIEAFRTCVSTIEGTLGWLANV